MLITQFKDLETFKVSRTFVKEIYQLSATGLMAKDFGLKDQLRRASVSILLNIAEGFSAGSSKSFVQFLRYSFRSSSEVRAILCVALDLKYINEKEYNKYDNQLENIQKMLSGFIRYLKQKDQSNS